MYSLWNFRAIWRIIFRLFDLSGSTRDENIHWTWKCCMSVQNFVFRDRNSMSKTKNISVADIAQCFYTSDSSFSASDIFLSRVFFYLVLKLSFTNMLYRTSDRTERNYFLNSKSSLFNFWKGLILERLEIIFWTQNQAFSIFGRPAGYVPAGLRTSNFVSGYFRTCSIDW
jgi:hypothetical protein